ncbi:MAG: dynamin family protein [Planctomycetota bacterium]
MLREILPQEAVDAVERERVLLERVREFADGCDPGGPDAERVAQLIEHLDEMFLLVVVGEVKAGKSSFINALLRSDVCPEGPLPLTDKVHVLAYGEQRAEEHPSEHVVRHALPVEQLERLNVVDTPGTNSPLKRHQEITESFLPRADIVFFVTSIDCPLTQTELQLLRRIRESWRKEIACILAKVDMHPERDRDVVLEYLGESFREYLGFSPPVFPVSAHLARKAHDENDADLLARSGLDAVENYIVENLSENQRILLKLRSPLGTVLDILGGIETALESRGKVLERDFAGWSAIQEQAEFSATSLRERVERHLTPILVSFENLEARGRAFLRDAIRLRNLPLVSDGAKFRAAFERDVVRAAATEIENHVEEAARWLGGETRSLWERSLAHFDKTVSIERYRDEIPAGLGPRFEQTRAETLERLTADARRGLEGWSVEGECKRVRQLASKSLARLLGTEVVAVGVGAAVLATIGATVVGLVGVLLAAATAVGGFFILPARRQKAIEGFEAGVRATREAVLDAVRSAVGAEADRAATAVLDAFAPFHDFYESRRRKLTDQAAAAKSMRSEVTTFQEELE